VFGAVLKRHIQSLRRTVNSKVELVFLVDESSSVGAANFDNELKFVKKLLADFTVDTYTTRVALITFSSPNRVRRHVDYLTTPSSENHKCALMHDHLPRVNYAGGSTFTLGAMLEAEVCVRLVQILVLVYLYSCCLLTRAYDRLILTYVTTAAEVVAATTTTMNE